jgi:hypothetical protein
MLWVPCLRLDLDDGAGLREEQALATSLRPVLEALDANPVAHLNLALTPAALAALERRAPALMSLLVRIAERRLIEFVETPAFGALLPLLPPSEIARQLQLNAAAAIARFGTLYRPATLWPPALALSSRVLEMAEREGYQLVLVDEASMRTDDGTWPGESLDAAEGHPGLFLVPVSRAASRAQRHFDLEPMDRCASHGPVTHPRYVVSASELTGRPVWLHALAEGLRRRRTLRIQDLWKHFPKDHTTAPAAGSGERSPWMTVAQATERAPLQAERTRRLTELAATLDALARTPARSLVEFRRLRSDLDAAWRAGRWLSLDSADVERLTERARRIRAASPLGLRAPAEVV